MMFAVVWSASVTAMTSAWMRISSSAICGSSCCQAPSTSASKRNGALVRRVRKPSETSREIWRANSSSRRMAPRASSSKRIPPREGVVTPEAPMPIIVPAVAAPIPMVT